MPCLPIERLHHVGLARVVLFKQDSKYDGEWWKGFALGMNASSKIKDTLRILQSLLARVVADCP